MEALFSHKFEDMPLASWRWRITFLTCQFLLD